MSLNAEISLSAKEMSGYLRILRGFQDESHLSRDVNGNNLLFKTSQVK
jgi:hypothetical protein